MKSLYLYKLTIAAKREHLTAKIDAFFHFLIFEYDVGDGFCLVEVSVLIGKRAIEMKWRRERGGVEDKGP